MNHIIVVIHKFCELDLNSSCYAKVFLCVFYFIQRLEILVNALIKSFKQSYFRVAFVLT